MEIGTLETWLFRIGGGWKTIGAGEEQEQRLPKPSTASQKFLRLSVSDSEPEVQAQMGAGAKEISVTRMTGEAHDVKSEAG